MMQNPGGNLLAFAGFVPVSAHVAGPKKRFMSKSGNSLACRELIGRVTMTKEHSTWPNRKRAISGSSSAPSSSYLPSSTGLPRRAPHRMRHRLRLLPPPRPRPPMRPLVPSASSLLLRPLRLTRPLPQLHPLQLHLPRPPRLHRLTPHLQAPRLLHRPPTNAGFGPVFAGPISAQGRGAFRPSVPDLRRGAGR